MVRDMLMVKMAWERELASLSLVLLTLRFSMHSAEKRPMSSAVWPLTSLGPTPWQGVGGREGAGEGAEGAKTK